MVRTHAPHVLIDVFISELGIKVGCTQHSTDMSEPHLEHASFVYSVLASAAFNPLQMSLRIPLPSKNTHMIMYISSDQQVTVDVQREGKTLYSAVHAPDMKKPMCPVFKH